MIKKLILKNYLLCLFAFIFGYIIGFLILNLKAYQNPNFNLFNINYKFYGNDYVYASLVNESNIRNLQEKIIPIIASSFKERLIGYSQYTDIQYKRLDNYRFAFNFNLILEDENEIENEVNKTMDILNNLVNETINRLASEAPKVIDFNYNNQTKLLNKIYSQLNVNSLDYLNRVWDLNKAYMQERNEFDYLLNIANKTDYFKFSLDNIKHRKLEINYILPFIYSLILMGLMIFYLLIRDNYSIKIESKD